MPVSPRNQDELATLGSSNPAAASEMSVMQSKINGPVLSNDTTDSAIFQQVETRDEAPKSEFDKWLQRANSDDLSLYYDSTEEQSQTSDPITGLVAAGREGAAPSVSLDSEEGKQELKETLAILGIGLNGEELAKDEEETSTPMKEKLDKSTLSTEIRLDNIIPQPPSDARESESDNVMTSSEKETKKEDPPASQHSTPNELPPSTSEEDVSLPSDEYIKNMIEKLNSSTLLAEADESIKSLDMALDNRVVSDKAARIHIAETITSLDGNRIIMHAMEKWQAHSSEIADVATCLLVALTQVVPDASKEIAKVGLDGIVKTGKEQPDNYFLRGNILALLLNLSTLEDEQTKQAISTDSCIDIVVQTMQKWPDKAYIQKCGAGYFVRINKIQAEQKETLKSEKVEEEPKKEARDVPMVPLPSAPKDEEKTQETKEAKISESPKTTKVPLPVVPKVEEKTQETKEVKASESEKYTKVPPSEEEVAKMLRRLRDSKDGDSAREAVKVLVRATDSRFIQSAVDRKKVAERIVRMNGVAAIILALEKWSSKSQKFSYYALTLLVSLSKFAAGSRQAIATIGCKTVLDTAGRYADDYYIRGNVLFLLQNLANYKNAATKYEVAASDCIDCVVDSMQRWPDDEPVQHCGCDYFARIVSISGMPSKLHSREIDVLLLGVIDTFQQKGKENEEICNRAKSVMDKIHADDL